MLGSATAAQAPGSSRALAVEFETDEDYQQLSPDQQVAIRWVLAGRNVFLTGRGGCGKTRVIKVLCKLLEEAAIPFGLTASTGQAANNIDGVTLHSYVNATPTDTSDAVLRKLRRFPNVIRKLKEAAVLVVDEVSMISAEVMETVLAVLEGARGRGKLPVLVLSGDFLQLRPVSGTVLLNSPVWDRLDIVPVLLQTNWRQRGHEKFLVVLDQVRKGRLTPEGDTFLQSRVVSNAAVEEAFVLAAAGMQMCPLFVAPGRAIVDARNRTELARLTSPVVVFVATISIAFKSRIDGEWVVEDEETQDMAEIQDPSVCDGALFRYPVKWGTPTPSATSGGRPTVPDVPILRAMMAEARKIFAVSLVPAKLELREGAQVRFTVNNRRDGIVNGMPGVLRTLAPDGSEVRVTTSSGIPIRVSPFVRSARFDGADTPGMDAYVTVKQLPLKLAYASTVHSAQGMSVSSAIVNAQGTFATGQTYTALSRVESPEGLVLTWFDPRCILVDAPIVEFYDKLEATPAEPPPVPPPAPSSRARTAPPAQPHVDGAVPKPAGTHCPCLLTRLLAARR